MNSKLLSSVKNNSRWLNFPSVSLPLCAKSHLSCIRKTNLLVLLYHYTYVHLLWLDFRLFNFWAAEGCIPYGPEAPRDVDRWSPSSYPTLQPCGLPSVPPPPLCRQLCSPLFQLCVLLPSPSHSSCTVRAAQFSPPSIMQTASPILTLPLLQHRWPGFNSSSALQMTPSWVEQ